MLTETGVLALDVPDASACSIRCACYSIRCVRYSIGCIVVDHAMVVDRPDLANCDNLDSRQTLGRYEPIAMGVTSQHNQNRVKPGKWIPNPE